MVCNGNLKEGHLGNGKPEGDLHTESRRLKYSGECTDLWYKQSIVTCGSEETRDVSEAGGG